MVYQEVTRNKNISAAAKGLYAYLSAYCGASDECYPSVDTITREMAMGKDTFYRHINALVAAGVVEKCQKIGEDGKFGRILYRITHEVYISEKPDFPFPENGDTDKPDTAVKETIINNSKNNNFKIIKENLCPEPKDSAPDLSGIVLPLVDGTNYDVPLDKIEKWKSAYPAVDIEQELKRMVAWLDDNPTRKKTRNGICRFINSWLGREQDNGWKYRNGNKQQSSKAKSTGFTNFQQRNYDMDELERQLLEAQKI